ncbi:glutamate cyclase domain-containing protein [Xylophilus sp. GOD-11R]|uniref:glutamate cyclase domain-containing protein n=1 Tax=Xylophilus sp. GOD-11R TaxID=3089814 RepID=UPI00298D5DEA|nr:glutamate cyclase domain-containing protein [Xylophilus sp. GOD-11R]WPB55963.1 DUF4392 domain-containing protein [Xylophilus sp. GOD-11R]
MPATEPLGVALSEADLRAYIEALLTHVRRRGIVGFRHPGEGMPEPGFHQPGAAMRAADHLLHNSRCVMLTGQYNVAAGKAETDGPIGVAVLAYVLNRLGRETTIVTDGLNEPIFRRALAALSPEAAFGMRVVTMDKRGPQAAERATWLLHDRRIDTVIASETPARNEEGVKRNMRGVVINGFNSDLDELLLQANRMQHVTSIGVGDGGNEAGMGGLSGIPLARDGSVMASAVKADIPVTSWNSNLGAITIAALLAHKAGRLDLMPTPAQFHALMHEAMAAGAIDGVSRSGSPSAGAGVDGVSLSTHTEIYADLLRHLQAAEQVAPTQAGQARSPDAARHMVGFFDSSDGGMIAVANLQKYLRQRFPHLDIQFVGMLDHQNAPYGTKTDAELIAMTNQGLMRLRDLSINEIAMACNTACLNLKFATGGVKVPVLDLIQVSADAIVAQGGPRPCGLSTMATAKSTRYPDTVREKGGPALRMVGCPDLATLVNEGAHQSLDPAVQQRLDKAVRSYVQQVPKDATSVFMLCTHYPALAPQIRRAMDQCGLSQVPLIDPMEYQAEKIGASKPARGAPAHLTAVERPAPVLVYTTSTDPAKVESLQKLIGDHGHVMIAPPRRVEDARHNAPSSASSTTA